MNNTYTPGVCNIGPDEIKQRFIAGWAGLAVTVVIAVALIYLNAPVWTRLALFLPALVGAIGFLQALMRFCVAFGSQGLFNMDKAAGATESVEKAEFRAADQKKSICIWMYAVLIALAVTTLAFFF